ncbi:MAG TPA: hypothetical protein VK171_17105 [Fimbriimonas sp.]|nr:hypothetical protein [Fimbriimonas sp.]
MRTAYILAGLALAGCSGNASTSSAPSKPKKIANVPSEDTILDIKYPSEVVGESKTWYPDKYDRTGEEKLSFTNEPPKARKLEPLSPTTIEVGGAVEDREGVESMVMHLKSAVRNRPLSIREFGFGPFGLTSELYGGHTFWDLDCWIVPAMAFLDPRMLGDYAEYRTHRFRISNGKIKFPWESSVSGKEVCLEETRLQEHISGDVVWGLTQAEAFGYADSYDVERIATGVAKYYRSRAVKTERGLEIQDVVSPNEKFRGDNDLYTNALAEWLAHGRGWQKTRKYVFPKDKDGFTNYDNDPLKDYQQAAGLLAIYPLQNPTLEQHAGKMIDRFADKISENGPAMGHSVVATIRARLGAKGNAYKAWKESWEPYTRNEKLLFSERRNTSRVYFYTGAAGAINTVIYGFAGFRVDTKVPAGSVWKKRLEGGYWLSCKPNVPPALEFVRLKNVLILGERYDFQMDSKGGFSVASR